MTGKKIGLAWMLCACLGVAAAPQRDLAPELLLLARIKQKMRENLARLPNYTCLQTIERWHQPGPTRPFARIDLIHIEVVQVGKKELFAWPGDRQFSDAGIGAMVSGGMIGNGDFALHARAIFGEGAPIFRYLGEGSPDGPPAARYEYRVAEFSSGYRLRLPGVQSVVGYHGEFVVDRASLELVKLAIVADAIPPELGLTSVVTRIEYGHTRIGSSDFLLPQRGEVLLTHKFGATRRNRIEFSNCRQYGVESVIVFEPAEARPASGSQKQVVEVQLPAGLTVNIALEKEIDSDSDAIGDLVKARVVNTVKYEGKTVIPEGAILTGRIRLLGRYPETRANFTVGLEFTEVEFAQTRARFTGDLVQAGSETGRGWSSSGRSGGVVTREIITTPVGVGTGTFFVEGHRVRLPRGFRMVWRTRSAPR